MEREPYPDVEYQSRRAYIFARKASSTLHSLTMTQTQTFPGAADMRSPKQDRLRRFVSRFLKIAQADTHQAKTLLRTQIYFRLQHQSYVRQFLTVYGGEDGVWLRVRILNSLVLSLSTTVRAIRDSLREAAQTFSAS